MPDKGKVVERLGRVSYYFTSLLAVGWQGDADIYREHMESVNTAIALLKEQEAESKMVLMRVDGNYCPHCSSITTRAMGVQRLFRGTRFCPYCGKEVKWDEDNR